MAAIRALIAAWVLGLSCMRPVCAYGEDMLYGNNENFYNNILELDQQEGEWLTEFSRSALLVREEAGVGFGDLVRTSRGSTTETPCEGSDLTKWDKLFSMLENSQMHETMLQHSMDNLLHAELRAQRGELLLSMEGVASACTNCDDSDRDGWRASLELHTSRMMELLQKTENQQQLLQQVLDSIQNLGAGPSGKDSTSNTVTMTSPTEDGCQVVRMLTAMGKDFQKIQTEIASAAQNSLPQGCEMALLFPLRSKRIFASVVPDSSMLLRSFTICLWAKATDTLNKTVLFSYGTRSNPQEIQLLLSGHTARFSVGGEAQLVEAQEAAVLGRWVHYCGAWSSDEGLASLWVDGRKAAGSSGVAENHTLPGGGAMLLGQEKNGCCGIAGFDDSFNSHLAFAGKMTGVNVWDRVLGDDEISQHARRDGACSTRGNVVGWGISEIIPHGGAQFTG
ncbi:LOW QUALITY PROTEIN: pentraxin-related protein PTX3-like [Brienomyrus brachyistius]|uniref:LOW QUALITY PROTEIN: pentraxin-related protein PTX3-like n=1 Tax=Brienomyrus brachyistius TaxID=42636 RepID=UPI0020B44812|nr:LOW QUALITY PROTEIN: pentraxin-related protein PTX3-like [Brienomyrus brachyistius]